MAQFNINNVMQLNHKHKVLELSTPQVMGILNTTPDSFSDGGQHNAITDALAHAKLMIEQGATIIDIGGESTRPGAPEVALEEELQRTIPVIRALRAESDVWISIDTSKAQVMREAIEAGADIINDVRALQEPGALEAAAECDAPICLMHMQGQPRSMQHNPTYNDVVSDVAAFLEQRMIDCDRVGIRRERLILDPGFGFGKSIEHNYQLLGALDEFHSLGVPILAGMSRKSMLFKLIDKAPNQCVAASVAAATIAAQKGAQIIRVHDVTETVDALKIVQQLQLVTINNKG